METPSDFQREIEELIIANRTEIDKKVLDDDKFKYRIGVTKNMMLRKEQFTNDFLALIATRTIYPDPTYQNGRLFEMIAFMMRKHTGLYRKYEPVNRLYFLFLANIYCNSNEYLETYPWVPILLSIFEQTGVTGEFIMDSKQYNELFDDCHVKGKIKADLDFAYVYDPIDKSHKPDPRYKNLSNTTIEHVSKSVIPSIGWLLLPPCKYGNTCYRQANKEHSSHFSHHPSVAGPSVAGPSQSGKMKRSRQSNVVGPYGGRSTYKKRKSKSNGRKSKRRNKKTRKHYIKRK